MRMVHTKTGSTYTIKNGRITREPSLDWDSLHGEAIINEICKITNPYAVGSSMSVYLPTTGKVLITSPIDRIDEMR